jgi:hypothetical protein
MSLFGISLMKYHGGETLQWCPHVNWNGYSADNSNKSPISFYFC